MTPVEQLAAAGLIAWAVVLGTVVGIERAHSSKAAGVRTMALVAGAAALVVVIGEELLASGGNQGDATRALHGVITGIGFLGAGTIVHSRNGVASGLTTAATVFIMAAVGAAVGAGYGILASVVTLLVLIVLRGLHRMDPSNWGTDKDDPGD